MHFEPIWRASRPYCIGLLFGTLLICRSQAAEQPLLALSNDSGLELKVRQDTGQYQVTYKGQSWLGLGSTSVRLGQRWYRSDNSEFIAQSSSEPAPGRLNLLASARSSGDDRLGSYDGVELTWQIPGQSRHLITGFKLYRNHPYLVFTQRFPQGFKDYANGNWMQPSVVFPQFLPGIETARKDLYSWVSGGLDTQRFAFGPASSLGGTVDLLILSDRSSDALVLSAFANFLVATQQSHPLSTRTETDPTKAVIDCGIEGLVKQIPVGFEHAHILVAGAGVTRTIRSWGQALLDRSGKPMPSKYDGDDMRYPTYWDDYGAYYREHGFKEDGFNSYEQLILGIARDAKQHGLRIGAYEIADSDQLQVEQGIFEPRADLFPHGLQWLHEQLDAPLDAYTSWLAAGGPYRKKYPYIATQRGDGKILGYPHGTLGDVFYSEEYWRDTAKKLKAWGAILLQQDYLSAYEGDPVMMADVYSMDRYLKNQAAALQREGLRMQYCMTLPRNLMESTENPIVISLQGPTDHHVYMAEPHPQHRDDDPYTWQHLMFASAVYGALGLWPSRDNIQTRADPNAWEDVLIANLLGGELQLGHKIGQADYELIAKTYRDGDDLILKPDRPIAPLDRCYRSGCAVGFSESQRDARRWYYILSLPMGGSGTQFSLSELGASGKWVAYDYDLRSASVVEADSTIALRSTGRHQYLIAAPLFASGMTVIGDTAKFIPMAEQRIASVRELAQHDGLQVGVIASAGHEPIIAGYSERTPRSVQASEQQLAELSSIGALQDEKSGWFWDALSGLWYVKLDFAGKAQMQTQEFSIR